MQVPLLDLQAQYRTIKSEIDDAVTALFDLQHFILGSAVEKCEALVSNYCDCRWGIGVSSGTDALLLVMMAENIGAGDEVITTPYTFFATAGCISRLGAKPVFVDIDPVTFNIDPEQIEAKITPRTKAIIPVHLYGQLADMESICEIAERHNLFVIEDACQAIGAEHEKRRAGSLGKYGCFSFFPSKNLGGAGDGGMVTTSSQAAAERLRSFRNHGETQRYHHKWVGGNFRLDAIQAAVVNVKLKYLDEWTAKRQANAALYNRLFAANPVLSHGCVETPRAVMDRHVFNQYVIRVKNRDALRDYLQKNDIGCAIYYPIPLHLQECFADLGYKPGDLPFSEQAAGETLALPIYPELKPDQIEWVVNTIERFYSGAYDARAAGRA